MGQENTFYANKQFGIRYAMKRKLSERAKSGEMPEAGQRASPLALAFLFCDLPELSVKQINFVFRLIKRIIGYVILQK